MAKTNYQIFNEENAPERTYNDSEYKEATQRVVGVMPGMALSRMHNKMYYQWSAMCKAIANLIVNRGRDCMDSDVEGITKALDETITSAASGASLNLLQRSRAYQVGDIAYHKALPSWARLECVWAGTTGAMLPNPAEVRKCGVMLTDGTAAWILDDVRDGARVGDIILRPTLRDGYIKANGATVKASEYPRLLAWVQESNMTVTAEQYTQDCSKYVYDSAQDRLTLPNATGRVLMGGENVKSVEAGLPNIEIRYRDRVYTYEWGWQQGQENKILEDKRKQVTLTNPDGQYSYAMGNGSVYGGIVTLDASRSNPIYGRSDTVQPPALTMIAQIKY